MKTTLLKSETLDYTISMDILLDVLKIIFQNNIPHKIKAALENDNSIVMNLSFDPLIRFHAEAKENIETFISDYRHFLHCSSAD